MSWWNNEEKKKIESKEEEEEEDENEDDGPERECSFQIFWSSEDKEWNCALMSSDDSDRYCDKTICPFWVDK
jgi:hypothetical protein